MAKQATIYMDFAAATPIDDDVLLAMQPYFQEAFYNPSATYSAAKRVKQALESARTSIAFWLGANSSEAIFTAGGSEANNLAIHGLMRRFPGGNIIVSEIEHESVLAPAGHYDVRYLPVTTDGIINTHALEALIDDQTVLISVMYANNEIGTIQPISSVSRLVTSVRQERQQTHADPSTQPLPIYLHTDACQAGNYLDLHVARLGVDLMTINGGKIYGPKQSGALYVRRGITLMPLVDGGGQERGLRSGTENVAASIGLSAALDKTQTMRKEESLRLKSLQQYFLKSLQQHIPSAVVNGSMQHRLPNNIHITLPGQDNERLIILLDQAGIAVAAGSACSASDETPSHVLKALGLDDTDAQASLRLTMGRTTTKQMVERTVQELGRLLPV